MAARKGQGRVMMVAGLALATAALVIGMKYFMSDDSAAVPQQPAAQQQLFKDQAPGEPPPGLAPAARSESSSGGALDMFSKTNAGYYGEDTSTPVAGAPADSTPEVRRSTHTAVKKSAAKQQPKGTVIPRMQAPKAFGTASPTSVAPHSAGQGMPDISNMLKQAQEQQKNSGN